jgi:hypothetical protein
MMMHEIMVTQCVNSTLHALVASNTNYVSANKILAVARCHFDEKCLFRGVSSILHFSNTGHYDWIKVHEAEPPRIDKI